MGNESLDSTVNKIRLGIVLLIALLPFPIIQIFHSSLYFESRIPPYLLFHNIAESFSIFVSMSIFGVGWFTYPQSKDRHTLFLGTVFLGIALMDMMHMLAYAGMPDFVTSNSPNKSTQYWIIVRIYAALCFCISAFLPNENNSGRLRWVFLIFPLLVSLVSFIVITFYPSLVPITFSATEGLTPFKRNSEFLAMGLLIFAMIAYWFRIRKYGWDPNKYYLYAFVFCILSELVFAVYTTVFDIYNILGHIYKIVSFYLIYKGVFISSINKPYKQLLDTNNLLKEEIIEHGRVRHDLAESLSEKEALIREIYHRSNNTLQVIGSLIFLQAETYPENKSVRLIAQRTQDRIHAISLVHRLLFAERDLSSISVRKYVSELADYVLRANEDSSRDVNLTVDVEDKKILMDVAIPIGLILSEFLSNTMKYAFQDSSSGNISISFFEDPSGRYVLNYSDDGVGMPKDYDFKNSTSLGIQLVQGVSEIQLAGKISFRTGPNFYCAIDFPIDIYKKRV
ncbi:histidine kinase [Leptospira langatensis]|uniref:histidine kinase n=1 Tax=Leptospira langatensis TaxID=2484983 RepID=A0A5F1ZRS3_9LEPT|nr:MASE3 domain-containing protein [Leptospira langatensis]TGJ98943.1 histidine kinase [Leptospira langatensis]TGL40488.1 histidine kinase [Leptospira langatensis]